MTMSTPLGPDYDWIKRYFISGTGENHMALDPKKVEEEKEKDEIEESGESEETDEEDEDDEEDDEDDAED